MKRALVVGLALVVTGTGHNGSLRGDVWREIETWIDRAVTRARLARTP